MCIQLHGVERTRTVLDPFLGIGASAIAAIQLGVGFYGFEIAPEYFEESSRLIKEATPAQATPVGEFQG